MASAALTPVKANIPLMLDIVERVALVGLFVRLLLMNYQAVTTSGHWFNWILVFSEGLTVFFLMVRRPAIDVSPRPADWVLAFFATAAPLLVLPAGGQALVPPFIGVSLLAIGVVTQVSAKLSLRRSFGIVPANRGVKMGGPYRYVRHPMYLGYLLVHIGFFTLTPNGWNLFVYAAGFTGQLFRLLAEERLLNEDPKYAQFCIAVPNRLIPGLF